MVHKATPPVETNSMASAANSVGSRSRPSGQTVTIVAHSTASARSDSSRDVHLQTESSRYFSTVPIPTQVDARPEGGPCPCDHHVIAEGRVSRYCAYAHQWSGINPFGHAAKVHELNVGIRSRGPRAT